MRSSLQKIQFPILTSLLRKFSLSPIPHPSSHSSIDICVESDSFLPCSSPTDVLNTRNDKWFVNLSSVGFPREAALLLQLGKKFSLPSSNLKRSSLIDFIKYFEYNINRPSLNSDLDLRSYGYHLLSEYLSSLPAFSLVKKNLLLWLDVMKNFCLNIRI